MDHHLWLLVEFEGRRVIGTLLAVDGAVSGGLVDVVADRRMRLGRDLDRGLRCCLPLVDLLLKSLRRQFHHGITVTLDG